MLIVSIPKSTEVGDVVTVTVNGIRCDLELGFDEIELIQDGKSQKRQLLGVLLNGEHITLVCD